MPARLAASRINDMDIVVLTFAASATALATGLGAVPVFFMGTRAEGLRPLLLGISIGAMTVASLLGLLKPALEEGSLASVALGLAAGVLLLVGAGALLGERDVRIGELRGGNVRLSVLVFGVLLVHSLPEGLAIGTAYASDRAGLSLFVMLAIAVQNIPEGTAIALPMQAAGFSRRRQFWAAVLTSTPQPVGAVVAFLVVEHVSGLLPASFAFAAGAMLALVAFELLPQIPWRHLRGAVAGTLAGAAVMLALAAAVGV
jgi:ZIP family zinc transporter